MRSAVLGAVAILLLHSAPGAAATDTPAAEPFVWSIVNPFRFYKQEQSFQPHRDAFDAIVKGGPIPLDIVARVERRLNDPGCSDPTNYDLCARELGANFETVRRGWASQSWGPAKSCYGSANGSYSYAVKCLRETGQSPREEDYLTPASHFIRVRLSDALAKAHAGKTCVWTFTAAGRSQSADRACDAPELIYEAPYPEGGDITVAEKDSASAAPFADTTIVVKDLLVVGMGDSYASGEGNPDQPARLDTNPNNTTYGQGLQSDAGLPIRLTADHTLPTNGPVASSYYEARARWTSPDCHRSQYSYQFRVALELAVERPHDAITLIHLACSGADTLQGVFGPMDAREPGVGDSPQVRSQIAVLTDLLCDQRSADTKTYDIWAPQAWGKASLSHNPIKFQGCAHRRREIDLLMLSLGGNDIGFSGLVAYGFANQDSDLLPIAGLQATASGSKRVFPPVPFYLRALGPNLSATRDALSDLMGVAPEKVIQTSYENIPVDEHNQTCSGRAGLDVFDHPKLAYIPGHVAQVESFAKSFLQVLQCNADNSVGCNKAWFPHPTGFHFLKTQDGFDGRGVCAQTDAEKTLFSVPRVTDFNRGFQPFDPANFLPYSHRRRLFVAPDDSYMTAFTMLDMPNCIGGFMYRLTSCPTATDKEQLLFAALFGGAFHRTAEAHSLIADKVLPIARAILGSP